MNKLLSIFALAISALLLTHAHAHAHDEEDRPPLGTQNVGHHDATTLDMKSDLGLDYVRDKCRDISSRSRCRRRDDCRWSSSRDRCRRRSSSNGGGGGGSRIAEGEYYIQNVDSDNFVGILYGRIKAPYVVIFPERAKWAKLRLHRLGGGEYAFESTYYDDRWICVGGDGRGLTSCQDENQYARFTMTESNNGRSYSIRAAGSRRYWNYEGINTNTGEYSVSLKTNSQGSSSRWRLIEPASYLDEGDEEDAIDSFEDIPLEDEAEMFKKSLYKSSA